MFLFLFARHVGVCVSVCLECAGSWQDQKRRANLLELELLAAVSCPGHVLEKQQMFWAIFPALQRLPNISCIPLNFCALFFPPFAWMKCCICSYLSSLLVAVLNSVQLFTVYRPHLLLLPMNCRTQQFTPGAFLPCFSSQLRVIVLYPSISINGCIAWKKKFPGCRNPLKMGVIFGSNPFASLTFVLKIHVFANEKKK